MSVSISASELFHAIHEIRLARCSLFRVFQRITQCAESDTLIVARHAPVFQHLFALGGIKDFFCTLYPAASQSHGVGGIQQIAYHERTVIEMCRCISVCQHDEHGGSAIEGVGFRPHHLGVEL